MAEMMKASVLELDRLHHVLGPNVRVHGNDKATVYFAPRRAIKVT